MLVDSWTRRQRQHGERIGAVDNRARLGQRGGTMIGRGERPPMFAHGKPIVGYRR